MCEGVPVDELAHVEQLMAVEGHPTRSENFLGSRDESLDTGVGSIQVLFELGRVTINANCEMQQEK
jgi:hypothetical protein